MRIDTDSDLYKNIRTILSGLSGIGASLITHNYCGHLISSCSDQNIKGQKTLMNLGRFGLEGVVMCNVTEEASCTIDKFAEAANNIFEAVEMYRSMKGEQKSNDNMITYEEN